MNRIAIYFLLIPFALLYSGCELTDNGAYDSSNFNEVNIDVVESEAQATVLQFDTLHINPAIFQTKETDETNLSYEWTVRTDERYLNAPIDEEVKTISNNKNLEYLITLTTGDWKFVCRVTDENTGVTSVGYFFVTVQNQFSEGWLVLEESGEMGDLSIILPDGSVFNKIYSAINPEMPLETPLRQLEVTNFPYGVDEIAILSENSAVQLDYSELLKLSDYSDWFWTPPTTIDPQFLEWHGTSSGWIINNGQVHLQVRGGFPGDKKYGTAMAFPNGGGNDYEAAPFAAEGSGPYPSVLYDNKGQFFVYLASGLSPILRNFPEAPVGAPFDMNDVGLEMVYMEQANEAFLINAVMKDESDTYYMLQFRADQAEPAASYQVMSVPGIASHTAFESSQTLERMYYSVGNEIYLYDIPSGLIIGSAFDLPGGEVITTMEIDTNDPSTLVVVTWDGSQGRVHMLEISGTGSLTLADTYSGFDQIIDIDYKD